MAGGDAQRVWFPEMVERLRSQWHQGMSFEAIVLRDELDTMLQQIRSERHNRTPLTRCPRCGRVGEGAPPHVSVRAMVLALTGSTFTANVGTWQPGSRRFAPIHKFDKTHIAMFFTIVARLRRALNFRVSEDSPEIGGLRRF